MSWNRSCTTLTDLQIAYGVGGGGWGGILQFYIHKKFWADAVHFNPINIMPIQIYLIYDHTHMPYQSENTFA